MYHNGANPGFRAAIVLAPSAKAGVVILTNGEAEAFAYTAARAFSNSSFSSDPCEARDLVDYWAELSRVASAAFIGDCCSCLIIIAAEPVPEPGLAAMATAQGDDVIGVRNVAPPVAHLLGEPGAASQMPDGVAVPARPGTVEGEVDHLAQEQDRGQRLLLLRGAPPRARGSE